MGAEGLPCLSARCGAVSVCPVRCGGVIMDGHQLSVAIRDLNRRLEDGLVVTLTTAWVVYIAPSKDGIYPAERITGHWKANRANKFIGGGT